MFRTMHAPFDCEGRFAAQGRVDDAWIARALELPFFAAPPPKSLDRNDFAALRLGDVPPADGAATLTAFTAAAIARIVPLLPKVPKSWIICGGGARNLTMIRNSARAVGAGDRRGLGDAWLGLRRHRGAGIRLSGRARPQGPAAELPRHHGGADADDGRGDREALTVTCRCIYFKCRCI